MVTYFVAFLMALVVSLALTVVVRNLAHRFGWLDRTGKTSRKIHTKPVPRLGGVAIVIGFYAPMFALLLVDSGVGVTYKHAPDLITGLFCGGILIALLGLYDDFHGADAYKKFGIQLAAAIALWFLGFRIDKLAMPFLGDYLPVGFFSLPLTVIWVVGVINAMNLIDGLDGLAGGVAFFAVATNFLLAYQRTDILMSLVMASLAGSVLGFLVFNFNPASIFMGDTGSMFLGFILAATSIKTSQKSGTAVALLVPVLALGLPIMDTLLAITRRALRGQPLFSADKDHIHHRLMRRLHLSHRGAVLVLYGVSCLFALLALGVAYTTSAQSALLLLCAAVVVIILMRKLGYTSLKEAQQLTSVRRRNLELRSVVSDCTTQLRAAEDLHAIWEALRPVAEAMKTSHMALRLEFASGLEVAREGITFEVIRSEGTGMPLNHAIEAIAAETKWGHIAVSWSDGREEVNRDEELALELLADAVAETTARLRMPRQSALARDRTEAERTTDAVQV